MERPEVIARWRRLRGDGRPCGCTASIRFAARCCACTPSRAPWRSALGWHGAAWALGALEIVGVLGLLGHRLSLADGLIIESMAQALRNAGFMLPGALGVQEGALIGAAALVGVPPAQALTVALVRRTREC